MRDAAVDLIGKYMIDSPTVAGDYYSKIADRIAVCPHLLPSLSVSLLTIDRILVLEYASESSSYSGHSMVSWTMPIEELIFASNW